MKKIYQLREEITFVEIKYRLLRNKNLIGIFTILSIFISSLLAYNQKTYYQGRIYFDSDPFKKVEDYQSSSIKINIDEINPSVRKFILDSQKLDNLRRKRNENVVTALAKNTIILRRAYSNLKSKNLFDQNEFKDFNSWSKKFSFSEKSNESEYIGIFFIDRNKKLVNDSLNTLSETIFKSPEYKRKMKAINYGYDFQPKIIKNKLIGNILVGNLVANNTFLGPTIEEISPISKFVIIFSGTLFGISIIILFSIYKDSLLGIISNQKKFIELIPYPLLRNFPIKEKNSWDKGLKLLKNEILNQNSNICLINITRKFPNELITLKNILYDYDKKSDILISNNISLENKFSKNILVVYPNEITEENLTILIQDLKNSGKNILGWIYLY